MSYIYPFEVATIAIATLGPAFLVLCLIPNLKFIKTKYIAALGLGLAVWFIFDTMGHANEIDVNATLYPVNLFGGSFISPECSIHPTMQNGALHVSNSAS